MPIQKLNWSIKHNAYIQVRILTSKPKMKEQGELDLPTFRLGEPGLSTFQWVKVSLKYSAWLWIQFHACVFFTLWIYGRLNCWNLTIVGALMSCVIQSKLSYFVAHWKGRAGGLHKAIPSLLYAENEKNW